MPRSTNERSTGGRKAYGMRYSITLLMVCLSSIIMAIWMKRSVMQPLGWHCEGTRGVVPCQWGGLAPGAVWPRWVP